MDKPMDQLLFKGSQKIAITTDFLSHFLLSFSFTLTANDQPKAQSKSPTPLCVALKYL
jgi:hypothetical protein